MRSHKINVTKEEVRDAMHMLIRNLPDKKERLEYLLFLQDLLIDVKTFLIHYLLDEHKEKLNES
jgi:hypothetical protein